MIIVDIVITVLLAVTIWFCFRLNKKIVELQRGKKDLAVLFKYFDGSIKRGEEAIESLKTSLHKSTLELDGKMKESHEIADELMFIIDKAQRTIRTLEDMNAKVMMKEQVHSSPANSMNNINRSNDVIANMPQKPVVSNNHSPSIISARTIITRPNNEHLEQTESKKVAIEALLEKISEVQKRSKHKADA